MYGNLALLVSCRCAIVPIVSLGVAACEELNGLALYSIYVAFKVGLVWHGMYYIPPAVYADYDAHMRVLATAVE
jgi:hypothetical protein